MFVPSSCMEIGPMRSRSDCGVSRPPEGRSATAMWIVSWDNGAAVCARPDSVGPFRTPRCWSSLSVARRSSRSGVNRLFFWRRSSAAARWRPTPRTPWPDRRKKPLPRQALPRRLANPLRFLPEWQQDQARNGLADALASCLAQGSRQIVTRSMRRVEARRLKGTEPEPWQNLPQAQFGGRPFRQPGRRSCGPWLRSTFASQCALVPFAKHQVAYQRGDREDSDAKDRNQD